MDDKGAQGAFEKMGKFNILTVVMVSGICPCVKIHQIIQIHAVNLCQLYFNKVVFKGSQM